MDQCAVLVRYKAEVTEVQKQEWKNEICALATKIPSVKEVNTGKKIPTERGKEWDDGKDQTSVTIVKVC